MDACLGRLDDFLRGKPDAVVDDVHASVRGARRDLLGAVGMAIEARLADEETDPPADFERDALDFAPQRIEACRFLTGARRDAGRGAKDAELRPERIAPFACRRASLRGLDR